MHASDLETPRKKKSLQQGGLGPGRTGRLCLGVRGRPRVRRLPCGGSGQCGTAAARMRTRAGRAREWSPRLDSRARAGAGAGGPNHFAIDYLSPSAALPVPVGGEPGTVLTPLSCSRSRSLNGRTPWGVSVGVGVGVGVGALAFLGVLSPSSCFFSLFRAWFRFSSLFYFLRTKL